MEGAFPVNLLRLIGSQLALQNSLTASREIFGRSYFTLGVLEKTALDQAVILALASNFQALTPEFLEGQQEKRPIGFPLKSQNPAPDGISNSKV